MRRSLRLTWMLLFTVAFASATAAAEGESRQPCHLEVKADLNVKVENTTQKMTADITVDFTWVWSGTTRSLLLDGITAKIAVNSQTVVDYSLNKEQMTVREGGESTVTKLDDLPAALRELFTGPICVSDLDKAGKETKRTVKLGEASKAVFGDDLMLNLMFFQPEPPPAGDSWKADREMGGGDAGAIRGSLAYMKIANSAPNSTFKVSGDVSAPDKIVPNGKGHRDYRARILGEQTYDPATRRWLSGHVDLDLSFGVTQGDKVMGTAAGTLKLSVEPRAAK